MGLGSVRLRSRSRNACLAAWFSCPFTPADDRSAPSLLHVGGSSIMGLCCAVYPCRMSRVDGLQFAATLVGDLVWPVFALIVIVVLRNPLAEPGAQLRSVGAGTFEAEFGEGEYGCHQRLGP
jgi:hypothetical protein